jgi:hypothetical protein
MNNEMDRVLLEARGAGVAVNGWQEGTGRISGFALVTDQTSGTTFGVRSDEPLAEALARARGRMAAGRQGRMPEAG